MSRRQQDWLPALYVVGIAFIILGWLGDSGIYAFFSIAGFGFVCVAFVIDWRTDKEEEYDRSN